MTKKEFFSSATEEEQISFLRKWFFNNYENPANCCPYEEGEYIYIWGGPYDAEEVLSEHFGKFVSKKVMSDVVNELEDISIEWSDIPENDEEELEYYINNSDHPYGVFLKSKREIEELLDETINNKNKLYKMLFAQSIGIMEQFLSSFFIYKIRNDFDLCFKFIKSCDELKKTKLEDFAESKMSISEYCCKHILEKIVWHKFKNVKKYYKDVLEIYFPEDIPIIHMGIEKRHHIIHRNGRDYDNNEVSINKEDVKELLNSITSFVDKISDITF